MNCTATLTDASGNTSPFSEPFAIPDSTPPSIDLNGPQEFTVECGTAYDEPGATADDNVDGDVSSLLQISGGVDENNPGIYPITYETTDQNGNTGQIVRTVTVVDTIAPVITVQGSLRESVAIGNTYTDLGALADDAYEGALDGDIVVSGTVDTNTPGEYEITYTVEDGTGNEVVAVRTNHPYLCQNRKEEYSWRIINIMDQAAALALVDGLKAIGAGLAMFGAIDAGAGIGILVSGAVQGIARNPDAAGNIQTNMILDIAFAEAVAIYALVVAWIILFVL